MARKLSDDKLADMAPFVAAVMRGTMNMRQAATAAGVSYKTMFMHCRTAGATFDGRRIPDEVIEQAAVMVKSGRSMRSIACELGHTRQALSRALVERKVI